MNVTEGQRVEHPNWTHDGKRRAGVVTHVPNDWHADVLFDGWTETVRAAQASLEAIAEAGA